MPNQPTDPPKTSKKTKIIIASIATGLVMAAAIGAGGSSDQQASQERNQSTAATSSRQDGSDAKADTVEPTVEKKMITETQPITFNKETVNDGALEEGLTRIRTAGVAGEKTLTYEVTITDGIAGEKKLIKEEITKPPVNEITAVGTRPKASCDPNYSGACVPIAYDVDCAGGSGNGPAYVRGPVYVIGNDIYDLDRDGNGVACQ